VQLPGGEAQLAEVVRALDAAGLHVASLHLHQPSLDDVFLAKTGRKLEGSSEEAEEPRGGTEPARTGGAGVASGLSEPQPAGAGRCGGRGGR
jgi:hypothetical protein